LEKDQTLAQDSSQYAFLKQSYPGFTTHQKRATTKNEKSISCCSCVFDLGGKKQENFDNTSKSVEAVFRKFQILFYTILYFHEKNPLAYNVAF
jgi:hypothetical protein